MALYDTFNQISPSLPPVGFPVLTVLFPLAFVPAVADIKACTSDPIATPKFVLDVPAADTSLRLLLGFRTPVTAAPENLYLIDSYVGILFLQ